MDGMVDISDKPVVLRRALACGFIRLRDTTIKRIKEGIVEKGDPLETSRVAAILAVKNTPQLIPYCHPIPIESVKVSHEIQDNGVKVCVEVKARAKTGVEMEALAGVSAALLTIWDMVKKYEKDAEGQYPETLIGDIKVIIKEKAPASHSGL